MTNKQEFDEIITRLDENINFNTESLRNVYMGFIAGYLAVIADELIKLNKGSRGDGEDE